MKLELGRLSTLNLKLGSRMSVTLTSVSKLWISHLLFCNKSSQIWWLKTVTFFFFYSHNFCGTGIQEQTSRVAVVLVFQLAVKILGHLVKEEPYKKEKIKRRWWQWVLKEE